MQLAVGVFAGIFDESGKILLRRRRGEILDIHYSYEGDWELPGGTVEEENVWKAKDEKVIGEELAREIKEETGLLINVPLMPTMYPALYINEERKVLDFAFVIPIGVVKEKPRIGENIYVSPKELKELAERPEGERLISGWEKRMCRMALMALCHSPNPQYREEARRMLLEIQEK